MRLLCALYLFFLILAPAALATPPQFARTIPTRDSSRDAEALQAIAAAKDAGVRVVQLRATWPRLQPEPGKWDFAWLDALVRQAAAQGLEVALVLGPAPAWTAPHLKNPSPEQLERAVPNRGSLVLCAEVLAKRYGAKIAYLQPWERPDCAHLLAGRNEALALFRAVTRAVHQVNPALRVIVPEPGGLQLGWIDALLAGCTAEERPDILLLDGSAHDLTTLAWRLRTLHAKVLPADDGPDLWASLHDGEVARAALLARQSATTLLLSCDARELPVLTEEDLAPCPADARTPDPVEGDTVRLDLSDKDPAGIHALPTFTGGEFRRMLCEDGEALCTVRDDAPWIHLAVPDGFLFYNREKLPVEVTVRVAGVTAPMRTGFSLMYDSANGMAYTRWQWIDALPSAVTTDSPTEFTYTFRLNDALFSDSEGYDLRIDMGGSRESVRVLDVAIRKILPEVPIPESCGTPVAEPAVQ